VPGYRGITQASAGLHDKGACRAPDRKRDVRKRFEVDRVGVYAAGTDFPVSGQLIKIDGMRPLA